MYMDDNYPNQALTCPARLMAVVVENDAPNKVYHPIVQWAGNWTYNDSVLFDEYAFDHKIDNDDMNLFHRHDVNSIEQPVFVIDCETANHNFVLVASDPEQWCEKFL